MDINDMLSFFKNRSFSIGVDVGNNAVKLVQLVNNGKNIRLLAGDSEIKPDEIAAGSASWQKWTIEVLRKHTSNGKFKGKNVVATIPANDVFVDHIRVPKVKNESLEDAAISKVKSKLPFEPSKAVIKCIPTEQDNAIIIAIERERINRHLAIYENTNLQLKSMIFWPEALTNNYTKFFGRRKSDANTIVMLIDIESGYTNIVVTRHSNLLYIRSIPIGTSHTKDGDGVNRLGLELSGCKRHFCSLYKNEQIERMIFLSGSSVERSIYTAIAKHMEIPAQMGDCLAAVELDDPGQTGIDRRGCSFSWATAFGLSLQE
jgi:hypothetical protein